MNYTPEDFQVCLNVLQVVARDPSLVNEEGRFKQLVAKIHRKGKKGKKRAQREIRQEQAREASRSTGIAPQSVNQEPGQTTTIYHLSRRCYICQSRFQQIHAHYHKLCPGCAEINWAKRQQRADLGGRVALITGGRIKIGYQTALKLLRDGSRVIVTTRFPVNARSRYLEEPDQADWIDRLQLVGLDLRNLTAVETFVARLQAQEPYLDLLIHNAAQTIKRPLAFYQHLLEGEQKEAETGTLIAGTVAPVLLEARSEYPDEFPGTEEFFPLAVMDADGEQEDRRPLHSWRLRLGQVSTLELLETLLVGTVSPFLLTSRLLPLLMASPHKRKFIVHVTGTEGQFNRPNKSPFHPHTNMSKAATGMLTRTVANDLADQGIYLNSVDTGWISDQRPYPAATKAREEGFQPPLDALDGAARIYDPIARGLNETAPPLHGHFLKDYLPHPW